jgi:glutathione synthase/RimK-type ligase-like ATP-grasp enzyme
MYLFDAIILTDARYVNPPRVDWYVDNVLREDGMVMEALEKRGLKVNRVNWDNPDFDWSTARYVIFRTTWDYFDRFPEFSEWLERIKDVTSMINPYDTIRWNLDKHYLGDLRRKGINIPPTLFIETGDPRSLVEITASTGWTEFVLKPVVSGGARHTYRLNQDNIGDHEGIFRDLLSSESMMLQEFQSRVINEGEVAHMLFGGKYSHAVLKKAKEGDYRVQDDFGGSVHDYHASPSEIEFAERVVSLCDPVPVYARVDVIRDNVGELCVSELELIEPELWFRNSPQAVELFAESFMDFISSN